MDKVVADIVKELQSSMIKYPLFNSAHEGYGVLLEELDELWDEVKKREPDLKNMRAEAVQVAAMAMKFIMSMENDWKPSIQAVAVRGKVTANGFTEKELQDDAKCLQCLYTTMTDEELAEMGHDPCDTCNDLSNWKPKAETEMVENVKSPDQSIDPNLMVCENCHNRQPGNEISPRCENCVDSDWGRPSNFVRRVVEK